MPTKGATNANRKNNMENPHTRRVPLLYLPPEQGGVARTVPA